MKYILLLALLASGCDGDPQTQIDMAVDRVIDASPDAITPDGMIPDAAVPDAQRPDAYHFARPGPRPIAPTVLGDRLDGISDLAHDGDQILALTRTGKLYALDGMGGQREVRDDLPNDARLLASSAGVLVIHEGGILPVVDGPTIEVSSVRRVIATDTALFWVDPAEGGRVARYPLPNGPLETVAAELGPVSAVWPKSDGTFLVGVGGDEPRRVITLAANGTLVNTIESRFIPEFFTELDGAVYAHMMTGAGWLERVEPNRMRRLAYVGRGAGDLRAVDGALWWHTNAAIVRAVPGEPPTAIRMGVHPTALLVEPNRIIWASSWRQQVLAIPRQLNAIR